MFSDYKEQEEFEKWAFGGRPERYSITTLMEWNSKHGEEYFVDPSENVYESLKKMITIYREKNNKENEI